MEDHYYYTSEIECDAEYAESTSDDLSLTQTSEPQSVDVDPPKKVEMVQHQCSISHHAYREGEGVFTALEKGTPHSDEKSAGSARNVQGSHHSA